MFNSKAYERHKIARKHHNFETALPEVLAEQAERSMKDIYMFDMFGITEPVIERRMVEKVKEVILELGYGFSFIGNQYRIVTPDSEYFIDLLFYYRMKIFKDLSLHGASPVVLRRLYKLCGKAYFLDLLRIYTQSIT